jgi:hypothetical protein
MEFSVLECAGRKDWEHGDSGGTGEGGLAAKRR